MSPRFLLVWIGQVVSQVGTVLSGFGAAVWVFIETGSYAWLTVLTVGVSLPPMLTAPLLGLIDRFDRRLVMIATDTGTAAITGSVLAIWALGDLRPWHLVVASLAGGAFGSIQGPAYAAAIPSLVTPENLGRANGLIQLGPSLSLVAAPGLAGLLIAGPGIGAVLAIDLATFAFAATTVTLVRFRATAPPPPEDDFRLTSVVRWLGREARPVGYLIGATAAVNVMLAVFNLAILVRGTILGGEAGAGLAPTMGGAGMILVSLLVGALGLPRRRIPAVGWSTAAFGGLTVAAAATPSLALFAVCIGLGISTAPLAQTIISTTLQERVQPEMHGRVFGLRNALGRGAYPLGVAPAGLLASWSPAGALVVAGIGLILIGAVTATNGALRSLDPPDRHRRSI